MILTSIGYPGSTRVFLECERLAQGQFTFIPFDDLMRNVHIEPDNDIWFAAWHPSYFKAMEKFPKCRFNVMWSSPIAQAESSDKQVELEYLILLKKLLARSTLKRLWFGSIDWTKSYFTEETKQGKTFWAPFPCTMQEQCKPERGEGRLVSLFGPKHWRKNIMLQLAACKIAGATVAVNGIDQKLLSWLLEMQIPNMDLGWMTPEVYRQSCANVDLGLMVSHLGVESLGYIFFDHLMQNTPCLFPYLFPHITSDEAQLYVLPDDLQGIAKKIKDPPQGNWRKLAEELSKNRNEAFLDCFRAANP